MMRFKRFRYSLGILMISAALCGFWQRANAEVEIPDPNLERAIRERLELSSEVPITQLEMLKLFRLNAKAVQIENLTGLEYATNLESLILEANRITDLSLLSNLTALQTLRLGHNFIVDISSLANLTQLKELSLVDNQIVDVSPLANLTQLTDLALGHNFIVDISSLANLTQLKELDLVDNQIKDVGALSNLTQLTDLALANNAITDFRPLFGLNLQRVDVDIHRLQELASSAIEIPDPNLERAIREELGLPSHLPLTEQVMLLLFSLSAEDVQIENLTGLESAHNLESLYIRNNPINDLTPIAGLRRLESLQLNGIPIEALTFLKDLTQLRHLELFACNITDITPLANLTKLVVLILGANRITDLSSLSNLTALETLWLQNNYIVDISPLANLTQLKELNLVDNLIKDVGALANLTRLERLAISANPILDFSPIQGLSIVDLRYDEVCVLPGFPIRDRVENRDFPSIFQPWDNGIGDLWDDLPKLSHLSIEDRIAYHDIYWHGVSNPFELEFQKYPPWSQLSGPIEFAVARRDELLAKNPNMLFLAHVVSTYTKPGGQFPEDWFGWVRDEAGNPVNARPTTYLIDYRRPEVQDVLVQQAVSVAQCGIFDGILYDTWGNGTYLKLHNRSLPYPDYDEETHAKLLQEEVEARTTILKRIREQVPDDFLILVNNFRKSPFSIPYINGGWMETNYDGWEDCLSDCGYTRSRIAEIEANLIWYEENARKPQITCLRALGIPTEPPDSPNNRRWMRLFTTMSLTCSDGYVLYTTGRRNHDHIWYPFWDADLGQPVGPIAQRYRDVEGLYIREFTNGWAVYNRSGRAQSITLPSSATPVSDRGSTAASITHLLPDLDGEIYLKAKHPADVNGDWVVDILDLIQVSNSFGKSSPDPNGDGVVNVLDLVFVSKHLD